MNAGEDMYFNTYDKDVVKESGIIVSDGPNAYFIKAYETDVALESEGNEKDFGDILKAHFTGKRILCLLWIAGILLFTLIYMEQYLKLRRRIKTAVRVEKNVWETEQTEIPFVMPGFPARIILPANLSPDKRKDILAHEKMHIRHYDPVIRFFATVALIVHWFNPFVWLAYHFMAKDMEMFCDESVLKDKSLDEKKQYSQTLLDFAMKNNGFSLTTSFGEKNTRSRIEHILYGRKPKQIISILLFVIVLCFGAFFLTGGEGEEAEFAKNEPLLSSHSGFWDYTGYLDECILWTGYEQFVNQDYDGDGKIDRVYRTYNNEEFLCNYKIELGNGMKIALLPDFSDKGEPVIQTADFNGDGENEIIFTMNYYTSTNPMAFGELEIFEKRKDGYRSMELPLVALSEDSYEKGLQFTYELVEKNWIRVTCKGTDFSQEFYISDDLCEANQNLFSGAISDCCVYQAEMIEENNMPKLKCRIAFLDKCSDIEVAAIIKYGNGMQIERIELVSKNM